VAIFVTAGLLHYSRRTHERLIEQTHRAERADQAKARLLTNLSREILTPLNSIIGFSEILQDGSRADQREYLGHIQIAGRRLLGTFMNLIDLSHSDERRLQSIPLGLAPSLNEAIKATQVQAAERRVAVDLALGDRQWPDVRADPWAVRRILENLLSNAIKYSNHGETVFVTLEGGDDLISISIRDTGIGMSADVVERLGETFFQADPGGGRRFEGMGAGVALSVQLAAAMGGELRFDSKPGRGTLAKLALPVARTLTTYHVKELKHAT
jgi:signal transduction histidine kinase